MALRDYVGCGRVLKAEKRCQLMPSPVTFLTSFLCLTCSFPSTVQRLLLFESLKLPGVQGRGAGVISPELLCQSPLWRVSFQAQQSLLVFAHCFLIDCWLASPVGLL